MTIDLDALEKLADEATPGSWRTAIYSRERVIVAGPTFKAFIKVLSKPPQSNGKECAIQADANAAFIAAANPATIKALIAELKEAKKHLARCVELVPASGAIEAADAFLARNGKGEG